MGGRVSVTSNPWCSTTQFFSLCLSCWSSIQRKVPCGDNLFSISFCWKIGIGSKDLFVWKQDSALNRIISFKLNEIAPQKCAADLKASFGDLRWNHKGYKMWTINDKKSRKAFVKTFLSSLPPPPPSSSSLLVCLVNWKSSIMIVHK